MVQIKNGSAAVDRTEPVEALGPPDQGVQEPPALTDASPKAPAVEVGAQESKAAIGTILEGVCQRPGCGKPTKRSSKPGETWNKHCSRECVFQDPAYRKALSERTSKANILAASDRILDDVLRLHRDKNHALFSKILEDIKALDLQLAQKRKDLSQFSEFIETLNPLLKLKGIAEIPLPDAKPVERSAAEGHIALYKQDGTGLRPFATNALKGFQCQVCFKPDGSPMTFIAESGLKKHKSGEAHKVRQAKAQEQQGGRA